MSAYNVCVTVDKPKVVIVAGGMAKRMGDVAKDIPKCLLDVAGKPLLEHQIRHMKSLGYKDYVFCLSHQAEKVRDYFGDGQEFGVAIEYSLENEPLGTAGAVKNAQNFLGDTSLIAYGDILSRMEYDEVLRFHRQKGSKFTVVVRPLQKGKKASSLIGLGEDGRITSFKEKPPAEEFKGDEQAYANNGIYVIEKGVLEQVSEGRAYDFAHDLIPELIKAGIPVYGYVTSEHFREVGNPEKYARLMEEEK